MKNAFEQNIIAMVWDFDKTLICNYMQEPLFRRYNIQANAFGMKLIVSSNSMLKETLISTVIRAT